VADLGVLVEQVCDHGRGHFQIALRLTPPATRGARLITSPNACEPQIRISEVPAEPIV
jgi:hypothetical protein